MSANKENYINFEHYCVNKHSKDFNHTSYHWSVIPDTVLIDSGYFTSEYELRMKRKNNNQVLKEYGLDGISIEEKNNSKIYHGLQMKLWNNTICANDIGTFVSVIFNRFSNESKGYLYHTSKLEKILKNDIINRNKIIEIKVDNPFNNVNIDNINTIFKIDNNIPIKLRPYQVEAIQKLNENWSGIKSLILPCGTGKTTIFNEYLKQNNFKNIFIFSPLTMLTEQNLDNIKKYISDYNHILVDINGTRDFNVIKENLNKYSIFSSTFKSAEDVISKIFEPEEKCILDDTILIVDEAHNLLNLNNLMKTIKKFNKVLLVTATPPSDMEDIIPNEIIYKYSFMDAIKDGYICDYLIYLPFIENNKVSIEQPYELIELDENICKKCLFLINGLLRTGSRRTIIYLKSKDECDIYFDALNDIMKNYHYYKVNISQITSDTNKKDRHNIMSYFEEESIEEEIKIILSIRILDEGINLIKCDSVYLTNLGDNTNDVRTIQRFLRANRKDSNNINKKANIFIWCEDTNICLNVFQMLKNNDIDFNKKIRILNNNYDTYYHDKQLLKESNINKYGIGNELIQNINIKCLTSEELWELKKDLLFEYCDNYKRIVENNIIYKNQKIGNWYKSQKMKIINDITNNSIIYNELIKNIYVKEDLENINYIEENTDKIINTDKLILTDFLKKYSAIPNQFIDDFFNLTNYQDIESNEKIVDLDKVIKWLNINKGMAKKTLIKSYKKNIDYTITKVYKPKGKGGQNAEKILLTILCFKKICQLTKSKKGNEVREYFIQVESLLNKYKNYIIDGMQDKIKKLEKSQKPKINPEKGVIYIFQTPNSSENSLYKIGRTKDLKQRLKSHQSPMAHDIEVLFYYESDNIKEIESCIKTLMKKYQYRKYKEVYKINIDIIKSLIEQCDSIIIDTDQKVKFAEMKDDPDKAYYINISK